MKDKRYLMLSGIVLLALAFTIGIGTAQDNPAPDNKTKDVVDDVKLYEGSVGPGSALYGLKIALENLGESLTFNEKDKIEKQIEHAELRLSEAKAEIKNNNIDAANMAIERYREKIQVADDRVSGIDRSDPGLVNAQERVVKHQFVLEQLLETHQNNTGLERALNNSQRLEEKFELKTKIKLEREPGEDRLRVRIREVEIEKKEIKAEIIDNKADVRVRVKFLSGGTDRNAIAQEILNKLKLNKDDINKLLEVETVRVSPTATPRATATPEAERLEERLKVKAEVGKDVSEVEVELRFPLNTINRDEIADAILQKLSALKIDDIQKVEIEIKQRREDRHEAEVRGREAEGEIRGREAEAERGGAGEAERGGAGEAESGSGGGGSSGGGGGGGGGGGK